MRRARCRCCPPPMADACPSPPCTHAARTSPRSVSIRVQDTRSVTRDASAPLPSGTLLPVLPPTALRVFVPLRRWGNHYPRHGQASMTTAAPSPPASAAPDISTAADGSDAFTLRFALGAYLILWPFLWASGRLDNPTHNLGMGTAFAATLALLCWRAAAPTSYRALRPWAIGAYQIVSPALFTISACQLQMQVPPTPGMMGVFADMMRVLTGCRAHMLLFLGAGLPLDLLPQMAVQTLSLASIIALRSDCQTPLMDSQLMEDRVLTVHALLAVCTVGTFPQGGLIHSSRQRQCAAALNFFLIFGGWVVPLFLVARRAAGAAAGRARQRRQVQTASQRAAVWLMRNVFMEMRAPHEPPADLRWAAWSFLVILSWLAAQLGASFHSC